MKRLKGTIKIGLLSLGLAISFSTQAKEKEARTKFLAHGHKHTYDDGRVEHKAYHSFSVNVEKITGKKEFISFGNMETRIEIRGNHVFLNSSKGDEMIYVGKADYDTFGGKISEGDGHKYRNINFDSESTIKIRMHHHKVRRHIVKNALRTFAPWTWELEASAISGVGIRIWKKKKIERMIEFESESGDKFCVTQNIKDVARFLFKACPKV